MRAAEFSGLADVVRDAARTCPEHAAIVFEDRTTTYAEMDAQSSGLANFLIKRGVVPGDRVAILSKNSALFFDILFAIPKAGAVVVPINWRLAPAEASVILDDAEPRLLFVERGLLSLVSAEQLAKQQIVIIEDGEKSARIDDDLTTIGGEDPQIPVQLGDTAMLIYTSGTTGRPKGAMITHANFIRHCDLDAPELPSWLGISPDEIALVVLPLFHVGGLEFSLRPMFTRATIILHREFDVPSVLRDIQRYRVTMAGFVPTGLQMMLDHPSAAAADLSSIRKFLYGAAAIPIELLKQGLEKIGCDFIQSYGMTEANGVCVMLSPEDHHDREAERLRSAGRPTFGTEIRILDSAGVELAVREVGEIAVRSSGVMAGYWRRPDASAEVLIGDGWLRSGDAGYVDEDGYVYICDRVKDMIVSGGENIYPAEVESAIFGHPAVAEVAVVGVPDPLWGEAPKAFIVPRPGCTAEAASVISWARERIAGYKLPRSIEVVDALPKNASGKILRREVRAQFLAKNAASTGESAGS